MKKVFIDANILISFVDSKRENHEEAKSLLESFYRGNMVMVFSEDILTNVVYNTKKLRKTAVEMFQDMNNDSAFKIVSFGKNVINRACRLYLKSDNFTKKGDFEDSLQYFCAVENGCCRIYTNDKSSFPKLDIPLYSSNNAVFYDPKCDRRE